MKKNQLSQERKGERDKEIKNKTMKYAKQEKARKNKEYTTIMLKKQTFPPQLQYSIQSTATWHGHLKQQPLT